MKKEIHKCCTCERIIGVEIFPGHKEKDEVIEKLECVRCYQKFDWSKK